MWMQSGMLALSQTTLLYDNNSEHKSSVCSFASFVPVFGIKELRLTQGARTKTLTKGTSEVLCLCEQRPRDVINYYTNRVS